MIETYFRSIHTRPEFKQLMQIHPARIAAPRDRYGKQCKTDAFIDDDRAEPVDVVRGLQMSPPGF